jgi:histone RNA hairpin-binding protein
MLFSERVAKSERETDDHRLQQRQKQIDYGKNTTGYLNYVAEVPMYVNPLSTG